MAQPTRILLADPDVEAVRALSRVLRERGYQVHHAPDGSRALELAVLRDPELVVFDEACGLVDARTFLGILRSNPRTEDLPVLLTGHVLEEDRLRGFEDGWLRKPIHPEEVLARLEHLLRQRDAARQLRGEARELEGSLGQLGVHDVLQMLAMNRRTGRLELRRDGETGDLYVGEGRPLHARTGTVEGEKAFFRLLTWTQGAFAFVPGPPTGKVRIQRGMEDALLEGMRQRDETARLRELLPPRSARLQRMPAEDAGGALAPIQEEVLALLRQPRTWATVLDLCPATDLDTSLALHALLARRLVAVADAPSEAAPSLLGPAEIHALRLRWGRGVTGWARAMGKLLVVAPPQMACSRLRAELPGFVPTGADSDATHSGFGTLGQLLLDDALVLEFSTLPSADAAKPLWRPFASGAAGALVLPEAKEEGALLVQFLASELHLPMGFVDAAVPPPVAGSSARAATGMRITGFGLFDTARMLLVRSLTPEGQGRRKSHLGQRS